MPRGHTASKQQCQDLDPAAQLLQPLQTFKNQTRWREKSIIAAVLTTRNHPVSCLCRSFQNPEGMLSLMLKSLFFFFLDFIRVDLQCSVNFCYTAE